MLTGRLPFHAATPQQMLAAHLATSAAPIQTYRPAVPVRITSHDALPGESTRPIAWPARG